jgi:amidase
MNSEEYRQYDGIGLAELVQKGEVTCQELLQAAFAEIDTWEPTLNALTERLDERANQRLEDGLPKGPFHGVPTLVKNSVPLKGTHSSMGSVLLKDMIAETTHIVVERIEETGVQYVGISNMSEFGLLPYTESALFGPTRNPWDPSVSPGGSSGGSAAAVAAGVVPFAIGGDGGGSIRIPASACGLFGLKPSRGRNPEELSAPPDGYVVYHTLTRSIRDSALMLDHTCGPRVGERWQLPTPNTPYADIIQRDPAPLNIAFSTRDFLGNPAHPECKQAVEQMATQLEALGHNVTEHAPDIDGQAFNDAFKVLWTQVPGLVVKEAQKIAAKSDKLPWILRKILQHRGLMQWFTGFYKQDGKPLLEPFTRLCAQIEATSTTSEVWTSWNVMRKAEFAMAQFLDNDADLFLTPVLNRPPDPIGTFNQQWSESQAEQFLSDYVAYTPIANACGFPAASIPTTHSKQGIPIGTHFLAPLGREDRILQLAAQIERAHPWAQSYKQIKRPS